MESIEVEVPIQLIGSGSKLPSYAYPGDAGLDLCSTDELVLKPFERALISTGIALAIPKGYAGFVLPRSGSALKHGLSLVNAPGLIDSNYRGEIKVIAINLDPKRSLTIYKNDRVAQLVIMQAPAVRLLACDELSESERGDGGFGSSGR